MTPIYQVNLELLGPINLYLGMGIQIVTAVFLGGVVGYDREKKRKAAGLKTNILICLGATLYTSVSLLNLGAINPANLDPNRVAAQIVSGIGFLGAGAIIQGRGNVIGLTTAATIWVVAAIGFTIGVGLPVTAAIFSFTVLIVLKAINPLSAFLESRKDNSYYHLEILSQGSVREDALEVLAVEIDQIEQIYEEPLAPGSPKVILHIFVESHPRPMEKITRSLVKIIQVEKVNFREVGRDQFEED